MPPILRGRRVTLRPPIDADIGTRFELGYDPEIHRLYGGSRDTLRPMTRERAASWFDWLARHPCGWAIEHVNLIGDIRLDNIDTQDRRASLAIGIADPAALGRGLGTEAISLACAHAFATMHLHRLSVRVLAFNERAVRAYQKCGFRVEGRERESALIDSVWHDDLIMGLLAGEGPRLERPDPEGSQTTQGSRT